MTKPIEPTTALSRPFGRRGFLIGAGAVGATVVVAACGGNDDDDTGATTGDNTDTTAADEAAAAGDLGVAAFAAGLEVLAVGTYKAALDAAVGKKLGPVPAAGAEFVQTAMAHHQAHLDAWNKVLTSNGKSEVTAPDPGLKPVVDEKFSKVKDFGGAAQLALELEQIAAATYLSAIPKLSSKDAITLAGQMNINDMQHAAVLNFVLGEYPVPDVFAKTEKAASPA